MADASNATWEQITAPSGSFLQDAINFIDNAFLGTLSGQQESTINQGVQSDINQAAAGDSALASSEYQQYLSDVNNAVYNGLPSGVEGFAQSLIKYAPWIAGGILLLYLAPALKGLKG